MKATGQKILKFTQRAWNQMWKLTLGCEIEISALGILVEGTNDTIEEFFVPKQICSGVSTDMSDDDLMALNVQLIQQGVDLKRICCYWHSHVNMATSPSGTDEATFDRLANGRYLWSLITNKAGAALALSGKPPGDGLYIRLDTYDPDNHANHASPFRHTLEKCDYKLVHPALEGEKEWVAAALAQVTQRQIVVQTVAGSRPVNGTYYGHFTGRDDYDDTVPWSMQGGWDRDVGTHKKNAPATQNNSTNSGSGKSTAGDYERRVQRLVKNHWLTSREGNYARSNAANPRVVGSIVKLYEYAVET